METIEALFNKSHPNQSTRETEWFEAKKPQVLER